MFIAFSIFGRGRSLQIHEPDVTRCDTMIYFRWTKMRRGSWRTRSFSLESFYDGGIAVRVTEGDRMRGWALRGPILHLES